MIEFSTNNSTNGEGVKGRGGELFYVLCCALFKNNNISYKCTAFSLMLKLSVREFNKVKLVSIYEKRRIMVVALTNIEYFILY